MGCASGKVVNKAIVLFKTIFYVICDLFTPTVQCTIILSCDYHMTSHNDIIPYRVVPHDLPRQCALVHGVGEVGGDLIDGGYESIAEGGERDTTVNTKHLIMVAHSSSTHKVQCTCICMLLINLKQSLGV